MTGKKLPTFDIEDAGNMLAKLDREIKRVELAYSREEAADHCFNAILTAWHIHDWVWQDIKGDGRKRHKLAGLADRPLRGFAKPAFQKFIVSHDEFGHTMRYCRMITTASKHGEFKLWEEDPEAPVLGGSPQGDPRWKVRVDGRPMLAVDVLRQAFEFWKWLISAEGIGGSSLGQLDETAVMPEQE